MHIVGDYGNPSYAFWNLQEFFFLNISNPQLVESADVEVTNTEGYTIQGWYQVHTHAHACAHTQQSKILQMMMKLG